MTTLANSLQNYLQKREYLEAKADRPKMITSIAEGYSRGGYMMKVTALSTIPDNSPKPDLQEDRSKLNGTLSLADLNEHRATNGLKTTLSQIDFDTLLKRTEGHFKGFETDATMNYRRNRYLWDMSECLTPKRSEP